MALVVCFTLGYTCEIKAGIIAVTGGIRNSSGANKWAPQRQATLPIQDGHSRWDAASGVPDIR